jgi:iron complex transport system ATP-binding protein
MPATPANFPPFSRLAVHHLRFAFAATPVIDELSFSLAPGELVAIVGPNGCGKSTLLNILLGALTPQSGHITLDDRPLRGYSRLALACRLALVPQMTGEVSTTFMEGAGFTVLQTVLMARYAAHAQSAGEAASGSLLRTAASLGIFGFETPDDHALATQAMWNADVHHLVERDVESLSGGERQRVAIARAFTQNTPILLLDEPTSALDLYHQLELIDQLQTLTKQGRLVVLVTHDLNLAATCASRILLLDTGRLVADGPPQKVLTPPTLELVYHVKVQAANGLLTFSRSAAAG